MSGGRSLGLCVALCGAVACTGEAPPAPIEEVEPVPSVPIALSMEVVPEPAPAPEPQDSGSEPPTRAVRLDGEPILVGAMSLGDFVEVLETHRPDLAKCSRPRLPEPKVVVKLTVAKDGQVIGASMKTSSGSPTVDHCLEKQFRSIRFPSHTSGLVVAAVPLDLGAERGALPVPVKPAPPKPEGPEVPEGGASPDGSTAPAPTPDGSSAPPG